MWAKHKQSGFTIVELLIVIVVIGILAAITIVAYSGIQNRAKTSSGKNLASQVLKKAETYRVIKSEYPSRVADFAAVNDSSLGSATVGDYWEDNIGSAGLDAAVTYNNGKRVVLAADIGSICIFSWDYSASPAGKRSVSPGNSCSGW